MMIDYGNIKLNLKENDLIDYSKIKLNLKENDLIDYSKINYTNINKSKTITLLKTINCVKVGDNKNYDCEVIEYYLRVCITKSIF